jgi:hypothetical protein
VGEAVCLKHVCSCVLRVRAQEMIGPILLLLGVSFISIVVTLIGRLSHRAVNRSVDLMQKRCSSKHLVRGQSTRGMSSRSSLRRSSSSEAAASDVPSEAAASDVVMAPAVRTTSPVRTASDVGTPFCSPRTMPSVETGAEGRRADDAASDRAVQAHAERDEVLWALLKEVARHVHSADQQHSPPSTAPSTVLAASEVPDSQAEYNTADEHDRRQESHAGHTIGHAIGHGGHEGSFAGASHGETELWLHPNCCTDGSIPDHQTGASVSGPGRASANLSRVRLAVGVAENEAPGHPTPTQRTPPPAHGHSSFL